MMSPAEAAAVAVVRAAVTSELRNIAICLGLEPADGTNADCLRGLILASATSISTAKAVRSSALSLMITAAYIDHDQADPSGKRRIDVMARRAAWYVLHGEGMGGPSIAKLDVEGRQWDASTVWDGIHGTGQRLRAGHGATIKAVAAAKSAYLRAIPTPVIAG